MTGRLFNGEDMRQEQKGPEIVLLIPPYDPGWAGLVDSFNSPN
jgi:hypothetical protein